jgi:hypothetical protein
MGDPVLGFHADDVIAGLTLPHQGGSTCRTAPCMAIDPHQPIGFFKMQNHLGHNTFVFISPFV